MQSCWIGWVVGDHLGDAIHHAIGHLQYSPNITHHRARLQLPESNNLRHAVTSIFVLHIVYDFAASVLAKVDIKIGHGYTFRVQETLKKQVQRQRVKVGNLQRPRHNRPATRSPPRTNWNIIFFRPFNKV